MDAGGGLAGWKRILWPREIGGALLAGLGVRLLLLPFFSDPYNYWGTYVATGLFVRNVDPFFVFSVDPRLQVLSPWGYPSLYFLVTTPAYALSFGSGYLYGIWVRIPNVVLDVGTTILLYRTARRLGAANGVARLAAYGFLFNPLAILVSAIWGTNDSIAVFFTALAVYLSSAKDEGSRLWGAWALGIGIAAKLYPILFLPVFLAKERRPALAAAKVFLSIVPMALTSLPFLVSDPSAYVSVLLHLSGGISGTNANLLDPQFTALALIVSAVGQLNSRVSLAVAAVLLLAVALTVRRVRAGTLDSVAACGLLLCFAYLFSVRWVTNYFLWFIPFVAPYAAIRLHGSARWVLSLFWVPALAFTLIYNGWYADTSSGSSGLAYWALVAGAPEVRAFNLVPGFTARLLVLLLVLWLVLAAFLFLFPDILERWPARFRLRWRVGTARALPEIRLRAGIAVLAASLLVFAGGTAYLTAHHTPVTPTDYGTLTAEPGGAYSFVDDFHADLLSFRWSFRGGGGYTLHPGDGAGLLVDTTPDGLAAYLEASLSATSVHVVTSFRLTAKYGLQPLVLFSEPGGRLAVQTSRVGSALRLNYYDFEEIRSYALDVPTAGWMDFRFDANATARVVRILNSTLSLPPASSLDWVRLGQPQDVVDGGGAFEVASVSLNWTGAPPSDEPSLPVSAIVAGAVIAASPFVIPARIFRRSGTGGTPPPPRRR